MNIRQTHLEDAQALLEFYSDNRDHWAIWEPTREANFYRLGYWQDELARRAQESAADRGYWFAAFDDQGKIIAVCSLTNIARGVFQAAYMGYAVAQAQQGQGVMTQLCQGVLNFAFEQLKLNRVMANYLPENTRSAALLERLGFVREGLAQRYLKINGRWRDHVLSALVSPLSRDDFVEA